MQHKDRGGKKRMAALLAAVVLVGGLVTLMMTDVPAPQKPIEKQLDAKDFLAPKQP